MNKEEIVEELTKKIQEELSIIINKLDDSAMYSKYGYKIDEIKFRDSVRMIRNFRDSRIKKIKIDNMDDEDDKKALIHLKAFIKIMRKKKGFIDWVFE